MSDKMTGIQTATVEPSEPKGPPVVPLAIGGVALLAVIGYFATQSGVDMGPWPSTGPLPDESTCTVTKGKGAVPDVDATGCHPAEMAKNELLPEEALMLPTASVDMFRSSKEGEWLVLRYQGVEADEATVDKVLAALAPTGETGDGNEGSMLLPPAWPTGDSWRPSWPMPDGDGTLKWVQTPAELKACSDETLDGAFVFLQGDTLVAAKIKAKADCPLWQQVQQRNRTPWKRPGGAFGGGGFGGGLGGGGLGGGLGGR